MRDRGGVMKNEMGMALSEANSDEAVSELPRGLW